MVASLGYLTLIILFLVAIKRRRKRTTFLLLIRKPTSFPAHASRAPKGRKPYDHLEQIIHGEWPTLLVNPEVNDIGYRRNIKRGIK